MLVGFVGLNQHVSNDLWPAAKAVDKEQVKNRFHLGHDPQPLGDQQDARGTDHDKVERYGHLPRGTVVDHDLTGADLERKRYGLGFARVKSSRDRQAVEPCRRRAFHDPVLTHARSDLATDRRRNEDVAVDAMEDVKATDAIQRDQGTGIRDDGCVRTISSTARNSAAHSSSV